MVQKASAPGVDPGSTTLVDPNTGKGTAVPDDARRVSALQKQIPAVSTPGPIQGTLPQPVSITFAGQLAAAQQVVSSKALKTEHTSVNGDKVQRNVESLIIPKSSNVKVLSVDKRNSSLASTIQWMIDGLAGFGAVSTCASVWPAVFGKFEITLELLGVSVISFVGAAAVAQLRKLIQ